MIDEMLATMSNDMGIEQFSNESEESFIYRLCYSALGQWCLYTAQNSSDGILGTTKHNQTIVLKELLERFSELYPYISNKFTDTNNHQMSLPVFIRKVYEETGYLFTDESNRNRLVNFGRNIAIGNSVLFFGVPNTSYTVNGFGVYSNSSIYNVCTREFLIRDDLTCEEYLKSKFDELDFFDKEIDYSELEYFNPLSSNTPSMSWRKKPETDYTVARKAETGTYYRVMKTSNNLQFADEPVDQQSDNFTSYEYRRLYFALKLHYGNPLQAIITKYDEKYSKIRLGGHLPNREYYFLLLLSWPEKNAFDKSNFIIRNDFLNEVSAVLKNIGVVIIGGHTNA